MVSFYLVEEVYKAAVGFVCPKFSFFLLTCSFNKCFEINLRKHGHCQFFVIFYRTFFNYINCSYYEFLKQLKNFLLNNSLCSKLFDVIDVVDSGFVNIMFSKNYIEIILKRKMFNFFRNIPFFYKEPKIILDFSSPNIAKQMHIGHLRSTILGDCLKKMFHLKGFYVVCLNHLGDWGLNLGLLISFIKNFSYIKKKKFSIFLLTFYYQQSRFLYSFNGIFKKIVLLEVLKLQRNNKKSINIWKYILNLSCCYIDKIYSILSIRDLNKRGESFYNYLLDIGTFYLQAKKLITISNGAYCVYLLNTSKDNVYSIPLLIKKNSNTYGYSATDFTALLYRILIENISYVLYVTDVGQSLHFEMLFKLVELLDFKNKFNNDNDVLLEHVPCGFILNKNGKKIKTRSGSNEDLASLIDTFVEINRNLTNNKYDIILNEYFLNIFSVNLFKFHELSLHRLSDYIYDIEKILTSSRYIYIFILHVFRKLKVVKKIFCKKIVFNKFCCKKIKFFILYEYELCLILNKFPVIFDFCLKNRVVNKLVEYLYTLSYYFNNFFEKCNIFSYNKYTQYLLCDCVFNILNECLYILNLKEIEFLK